MQKIPNRLAIVAVMTLMAVNFSALPTWGQEQAPQRTVDEIRQESTRSNQSGIGRPLPLAANWNGSGAYNQGFTPEYQLQQIRHGHHLLPWLEWPPIDRFFDENFKPNDPRRQQYIDSRIKAYEPIVKELARLRLPLSFLATQWESELTYDKAFLDLPPDKNPNVVGLDGKVQHGVSPFGPVEPCEVGRRWTDNAFMKQIQAWYPDPPLVLLISNNEHTKLTWSEVEQSRRYLDKYGRGRSDDFKRKIVGDGWIERYGAMFESMRAGLVSPTWRKNVRFMGYEAFAPVHFGRWSGWKEYSLITAGRLDPNPFYWDGGSPSYYLHNWSALTDYTLWSPQIESMNWVFAIKDALRVRPEFWFREPLTWDGDQPGQVSDKRMFYARQGQPFTPDRYEGFVQFGLWLTQPRSVREFRGSLETVEYAGPYFDPVMKSVDRIYDNEVLQRFWRKGTLVADHGRKHPYQSDVPQEYKDIDRWFLLETSLTPKELRAQEFDNAKPPATQTEIPVFALALVVGTKPHREWLVLANAPREARTGVRITVPDYGDITVNVPQSGSFFHVSENGKQVRTAIAGGPASFHLDAPSFLDVGAKGSFRVTEKYSHSGTIGPAQWEFGDGEKVTGDQVAHSYAKPGQYLLSVTGSDGGAELARRQVPVYVGLKREDDLVCRLLMKGALAKGMKSWQWQSTWDKIEFHFIPDASGAGNIGFLAGGKWVDDPQRGTVLEVDGKHDHVEISRSADINTGPKYRNRTVALWFRAGNADKSATPSPKNKPKPQPHPKPQPQVLYEEGGPGSGINLYLEGERLYAGVWTEGKGVWLPSESVERGRWHHAAVVLRGIKGNEAELMVESYLDGQKIGEGKAPVLGAHPGDINIGRCGNTLLNDGRAVQNPGDYFAGRIDDFRIINRALTPDEIRALAKGG